MVRLTDSPDVYRGLKTTMQQQQHIHYEIQKTYILYVLIHNLTLTLSYRLLFATSLSAFKHKLNRNIRVPPKFYFTRKRLGQIYHARLRTNCSSLNLHLFSKHLTDSPLCACGSIEDTYHFY